MRTMLVKNRINKLLYVKYSVSLNKAVNIPIKIKYPKMTAVLIFSVTHKYFSIKMSDDKTSV